MSSGGQVQNFGDIRIDGQGSQLIINQILQISVAEIKTRPFVASSPYVGLARFEERHKDVFFGRDAVIAKLLGMVATKNLVLVAGASGSGKSSLVRSGLLPQLVERLPKGRFKPLIFTPDRDPFFSLRSALLGIGFSQSQTVEVRGDSELPLASVLQKLRPQQEQWLLFVDQFEELFTLSDKSTRARFLDGLAAMGGASATDIKVVLAMRADFFDQLGSYPSLAAFAESNLCLVTDMQASELRAAIEQPASRHGVLFEEGLVEQIIGDVQGRPGTLPLLQYTLDLLWAKDNPVDDRTLNTLNYHKLGGIEGALRLRADTLYLYADPANQTPRPASSQEAMRQVFLRLVDLTSQGTDARAVSRRARRSDFSSPEEVQLIVELVDEKLLVSNAPLGTEPTAGAATIEIAHEALLSAWPTLKGWIELGREVIYIRNRLAADARRWNEVKTKTPGAADDELWSGTRLTQAEELRARGDFRTVLGGLAAEDALFLDASLELRDRREAQEAERLCRERETEERLAEEKRQKEQQKLEAAQTLARRTRWAAVVLGVFFVGALGAGGLAYRNAIEAKKNAIKAENNATEAKKNATEAQRKAEESRANLLVALAQTVKEDTAAVATLLREPGHQDSTLWSQSAMDAIQTGIPEVLRGHESSVNSVAFSPDGRKIVTGSSDSTARIWNADGSGSPVVLMGHESSVNSVAFSPDGRKIVTGSSDSTARIWNADGSGSPVVLMGHESSVNSVAFSPDGRKIVTGSSDSTARIWNADGSGSPIVLKGHESFISSVAFSPDGKKIVTSSWDKSARIWNADGSGSPVVLMGHGPFVLSVAFSPDGRKIVTRSADGPVRIGNADGSGSPVVVKGHESSVTSVAFSPDGKRIVTGRRDKTARIGNADGSGSPVVVKGHESSVTSVAFSPDGKKIVTGSEDRTARIWNADGSGSPVVLMGHQASVDLVAFSPDGKNIFTGSDHKPARIWNADGSGSPVVLKGLWLAVDSVAFSPDGRKIVTGRFDGTARILNADGSGSPVVLKGHESSVSSVAFSHDGRKIVTGSSDSTACIWNTDGSGSPVVLKGHESSVMSVAFSHDGKRIVTGSGDKTARIWNADGSSSPVVLKGHESSVMSVAFSPDGKKIVTGSEDRTARIWNVDGSSAPVVLKGHQGSVKSVAFSPCGKKIVTGSMDETARIWNVDGSGAPVVLKGHESSVMSVAFSPDGKKIVTGHGDQTARIWIVSSDALLTALWDATTDCLPIDRRRELLFESNDDAKQGYARCRQEVARRRGGPAPPAP